MKTKNLVVMALFIAIGYVLHAVVPGIGQAGMKPDFSLIMMFLGILLFPDRKSVLLLGLATGLVSGLTTTFPGGLVPNIIDKFVTGFAFYGLFLLIKQNRHIVTIVVLSAVGTLISGLTFLGSAFLIVGLPGPFTVLFNMVVLPTMAFNAAVMLVLYPIVVTIAKRAKFVSFA